jgi:uncharacterized membrane protein
MNGTKKLVYTALSTALVAVLTMFPHIPVAKGYIHLGDGMIIISAFILGLYAVPAAAIGSALADIITGYAIYAPATFAIKAAMALLAFLILNKKDDPLRVVAGSLACEAVMAVGYFLCDFLLFGISVALTSFPFSLIQAAGGTAVGVALCLVIKKLGIKEKIWAS